MALGLIENDWELTLPSSSHDWYHTVENLGYGFDRIPAGTKNSIGLCGYLDAMCYRMDLLWIQQHYLLSVMMMKYQWRFWHFCYWIPTVWHIECLAFLLPDTNYDTRNCRYLDEVTIVKRIRKWWWWYLASF